MKTELQTAREKYKYLEETGEIRYRADESKRVGWSGKGGYRSLRFQGKIYFEHRFAWFMNYGVWPIKELDHINGITSDNRIENLREVTRSENQWNKKNPQKNNKSGFLGVYKDKHSGRYKAKIRVFSKERHLGYFDTAEKAHAAYLEAKSRLHPTCDMTTKQSDEQAKDERVTL